MAEQGRSQAAVVRGAHAERVGPIGHEPADRPEVAGRGQTTRVHDQDRLRQPLDLLEDVRGEEDRPAGRGHRLEQAHHVQPLARVHAVERLVEQQDRRVVDQGAGELGALAHALGVRGDRAVGDLGQLDRRDGLPRRGVRVGQVVEPRVEPDELEAGQEGVDRLALRDQSDLGVHLGAAQAVRPCTRTSPADGFSRPAIRCRRVDLPAPLGRAGR